jgi:hypothetical protein
MDIKFMNQPKEVKMGNLLKKRLEENFDEIFIVSGIVKDSGIEFLMESFEIAINNGSKINTLLGVDRKNTSKDVLLKLLAMGINLSIHVNMEEDKVETRIYAFESKNGDSYVYLSGGKFSEGGLFENTCLITEIKYTKDEKEEFKLFKHQLLQSTDNTFKSVDKDDITLLATKGEILTRIIDRKIPSISELYGNKEQTIGEQVYDEGASMGLFNIDELENVDIEFDMGIELRKNVELAVEKEAKKDIFEGTTKTEEDLKRLLGTKQEEAEEETKKTKIIKDLKETDYKNMTTLIIDAGKIAKSGADTGKIKMPKALASSMMDFFNLLESGETKVTFEIMDNKNGKEYGASDASLNNTSKGLSISSDIISTLELLEDDIVRFVKIEDNKFRCEIIRKGTEEYLVWEKYCTNNIRGTERRYGII